MIIHSEELIALPADLERWPRQRPQRPRAPGPHVMQIVRRIAIASGKLRDRDPGWEQLESDQTRTAYPWLFAMGDMWEEYRASCYPTTELDWQPEELSRDGISGNPDGWWVQLLEKSSGNYTTERLDWECKWTSAKCKPVSECWLYVKQFLSYAAMSGTRKVCCEVLWLGEPYNPKATRTVLEFTQAECDQWWTIMKREAQLL